jgi:hypothetical protein
MFMPSKPFKPVSSGNIVGISFSIDMNWGQKCCLQKMFNGGLGLGNII